MSSLGFSGSGALYVATAATPGFDPATTFGFTGQPSSVNLPAGLAVSLSYTLPGNIVTAFAHVVPGFTGAGLQTLATLSTSGFAMDAAVVFGTADNGLEVDADKNNGTGYYLDSLHFKFALGVQNQVSLSGTGYLELPALTSGGQPSALSVTTGGSFNLTSLTLALNLSVGNWNNALGISGLDVQDFGGSFGVTFGSGVPTPSLSVYADNLVLPAAWGQLLGIVPGSTIWFDANLNLAQPVLGIGIDGVYGQPALTPLAVDPYVSSARVNSFTVSAASFELAPSGGTSKTGDALSPGASLLFSAQVDSIPVWVNATVNLTAPWVFAEVSIGSFPLGPVQVTGSWFYLYASPTGAGMDLEGGFSYGGDSFYADISLMLGSTVNAASVTFLVTAGLPSFLSNYVSGGAYVDLGGAVIGDRSGAYVSVYGSAWLTANGKTLGPVSFGMTFSSGLHWSDASNSITQVATFFANAGSSFNQLVSILEQFGYSTAAAAQAAYTALGL